MLFPGQGVPVAEARDSVRERAPELLECLGELGLSDAFERAADSTEHAQPAIYCASLAGARALMTDSGESPSFAAGHSLGEYAALVSAGVLDPVEGLRLVALRGRVVQRAVDAHDSNGMIATRATLDQAEEVAAASGVAVANDNAPGELVLSGSTEGLDRAAARLRELGVRSMRLPVAGAFHSPIVGPAEEPLAAALAEVDLRPPRFPVMSCMTARPFEDVRETLARSVSQPVRWRELVEWLVDNGVDRFLETGPGSVLSGLVRKVLRKGGYTNVEVTGRATGDAA